MRILTYAMPDISSGWQQLLTQAGLQVSLTGFTPPVPPSVQVLARQPWEAMLIQRGWEDIVLERLADAQQSTEALAPIYVLGGPVCQQDAREALRRGATACVRDQELGCLAQMLQQEAKLSYLRFLSREHAWLQSGEPNMLPRPLSSAADIGPALCQHARELNTLIMSITLYVELMLEQSCLDTIVAADLERVLASAEKASDLVQRLRALYIKCVASA